MVNDTWGENIYYCGIQPLSEPLLYQIEWTLTSKLSRDRFLRQSDFILHDEGFRQATSLDEQTLRDNNVTKIGYTVSISQFKC